MQINLNDIKLLIFDLDGTLVNSLPDLTDGVNYALSKLNRPTINPEQTAKIVGGGLLKLLQLAIGSTDEELIHQTRLFFMEYYNENYVNKTTYYDGVPDMLSHFTNKTKVVFSNKLHEYTVKTVQKLQLDSHFVKIMGAKPEQYNPKPSPEGIHIILKELDISPKNAIMIGDSTHDINAGKEAGVYTCGVTYGYRSKQLLVRAKPNFLIDDIKDLKKYLMD